MLCSRLAKSNIAVVFFVLACLYFYIMYLCFSTISHFTEISNHAARYSQLPQFFVQYKSPVHIRNHSKGFIAFHCPVVLSVLRILSHENSSVIQQKLSLFFKLPVSVFIVNCSVDTDWLPKKLCKPLMNRKAAYMKKFSWKQVIKKDVVDVTGVELTYRNRTENLGSEMTVMWPMASILHCKDLDHKSLIHVFSTYVITIRNEDLNKPLGGTVTSWKFAVATLSSKSGRGQFADDIMDILLQSFDLNAWKQRRRRSILFPKTPGVFQDVATAPLDLVSPTPRTILAPRTLTLQQESTSLLTQNAIAPSALPKVRHSDETATSIDFLSFSASTVKHSSYISEDFLEPSLKTTSTSLFKASGSGSGSGNFFVSPDHSSSTNASDLSEQPSSFVHNTPNALSTSRYREKPLRSFSPKENNFLSSPIFTRLTNSFHVLPVTNPHAVSSTFVSHVLHESMKSLTQNASSWPSSTSAFTASHGISGETVHTNSETAIDLSYKPRAPSSLRRLGPSKMSTQTDEPAIFPEKPETTRFYPYTSQMRFKSGQGAGFSTTPHMTEPKPWETKKTNEPLIVSKVATQGKLFSVDLPTNWREILHFEQAVLVTRPHLLRCMDYNRTSQRLIGVCLDASSEAVIINVTLNVTKVTPRPSFVRVLVSIKHNAFLRKPEYIVVTNMSIHSKSLQEAACFGSSSHVAPTALFIRKLTNFLPHLSPDDVTVVLSNTTCRVNNTDASQAATLSLSWFIDKIGYDLFTKHYYPLLVMPGNKQCSKEFFFALLPEFIMQALVVKRASDLDMKEIPDKVNKGTVLPVALPVCIVASFVLCLCVFLLMKRRKVKKPLPGKSIWQDWMLYSSRKPAFLAEELELDRFPPSKPRILPKEERPKQNNPAARRKSIIQGNVSLVAEDRVHDNHDFSSTDILPNQFSTIETGTYSFVSGRFVAEDEKSSTCSDTSASSFFYDEA